MEVPHDNKGYKMSRLLLLSVFLSFFMSSFANANETPFSVGIGTNVSYIYRDSYEDDYDLYDLSTVHYSINSKFQVMKYLAVGIGYLKGDSDNVNVVLDLFTDTKIEYSAIVLFAELSYPISERNYLYAQVNINKFDYDIVNDGDLVFSDDGNKLGYSLGWMYKFDSDIGMKAGYERLDLDGIEMHGLTMGVNYNF